MKMITIQVTDEEHKNIKVAATKAGLTIKDYLLRKKVLSLDEKNIRNLEALKEQPREPSSKKEVSKDTDVPPEPHYEEMQF